jgi:hypothetical protein
MSLSESSVKSEIALQGAPPVNGQPWLDQHRFPECMVEEYECVCSARLMDLPHRSVSSSFEPCYLFGCGHLAGTSYLLAGIDQMTMHGIRCRQTSWRSTGDLHSPTF